MGLLVGTSGWHYSHWRDAWYPPRTPASRWLAVYAQTFPTVEINATFYRMPALSTFEGWRETVGDGFTFAVKASRYLTHVRRLRDPRGPVELFLERSNALGPHRGPILLQLPPDLPVDLDRLGETLEAFGRGVRVAVELRHQSWWRDDTHALLATYGAALCLTDRRGPSSPLWRTAPWGYVRFHAGRARPEPCYGDTALRSWADRIRQLWPPGADVYAYFNNDQHACAPRNALRLRALYARRHEATAKRE